jgi:DNA-binding response OmpR family regulator
LEYLLPKGNYRTLIVDDDKEICEALSESLDMEGIAADSISEPNLIMEKLGTGDYQLILLDQNLSGQKGTDWLKLIRKTPKFNDIPVIMLTGDFESKDKVKALDIGADDYVVKPFSVGELAARIRAVLRRHIKLKPTDIIDENGLHLNKRTHEVSLNGNPISLTLTEFNLLSEILSYQDEILTRDHLRQNAIGKVNVTDRTIDVHMAAIRKKLGTWADDIATIRGVGYRYAKKA